MFSLRSLSQVSRSLSIPGMTRIRRSTAVTISGMMTTSSRAIEASTMARDSVRVIARLTLDNFGPREPNTGRRSKNRIGRLMSRAMKVPMINGETMARKVRTRLTTASKR